MRKLFLLVLIALLAIPGAGNVLAAGATTSYAVGECGETTVTAAYTGNVTNMYLVVDTMESGVQYAQIPNDGTSVSITVGPFFADTTVYWHVFGGGERNYDQPLWNGYGEADFVADINAYADSVGTWNWVIADTDDPNPFVTWNEIPVQGCPITKDQFDEAFTPAGNNFSFKGFYFFTNSAIFF